jgi:thymidylate synthase (FAD)
MQVRHISTTKPEDPNLTPEGLIAYIARVSSPNQENPDYAQLLRYCIREKHWSIFEMVDMTVEIITTRAIAPQILRHKSFCFQEFCISGDSLITTVAICGRTKKIPIKKLYEYQFDPRMQVVWDKGVRVFDGFTQTFIRATIKEIFKTGVKPVYEVTLSDGKKIKSTLDHKFLSRHGFVRLESLAVGDFIAVNGIPVYQSKDWLSQAKQESIDDKTGLQGIADKAGCSYHTIRKWLKIHQLQFTKKEVAQFTEAWNKGLPSEEQPMYGKVVPPEIRKKMSRSSRRGTDSNLYKNGNSTNRSFRQEIYKWQNKYKNYLLKKFDEQCQHCYSTKNLQIDHIKNVSLYPELAFDLDNLQILCVDCHKSKSKDETTKAKQTATWKRIESISFVGEEETYDIEVNHDSHNYVANGVIVHNSQRYAEAMDFEPCEARRQDLKNRQNSIDDLPFEVKEDFLFYQYIVWDFAYARYQEAIAAGVAKECARMLLPLNTKTRMYMKGSVRSWIHYLEVRCHPSTQKEHRDIALAIKEIFIAQFPTVSEALDY